MFVELWMVGVWKVPHSNQDTQASIESYHGALKRWLTLDTKGLRGHRIDWLVWRLTATIARHYMHTLETKKRGFIKNKVMEAIITRSVEKGSPPTLFLNLLPLAITTLKKKPLIIIMLILNNYTISNNKEKIIAATIEEGDDIAAITFFAAKPQKKDKFAISFQQSEEGGGSCRLLLQYKVLAFFAMLRRKNKLCKIKEEEGDGSCRRLLHGVAVQLHNRKKKVELLCNTTPHHEKEVELHHYNSSLFFLLWSCAVTQLHNRKKKVELRYSIVPQHEEGDGNYRRLLCYALAVL